MQGPPPPTNFSRRQEYHEAAGGRHGGGRQGGGRGGRLGERGRSGYGNQAMRYNFGGSSTNDRGSLDDNVVADMKLGPSGHRDATLRHKYPPFQKPFQVACYSRTADGSVHWDERCLRQFRRGIMSDSGADLNVGFESYVEKRDRGFRDGGGFGDLLACLKAKRVLLNDIHFVTFRNNLNKILGTAYNRNIPWEIGVYKRQGTVYLDVIQLPEPPPTEQQQRNCYWGYSFERLATEQGPGARHGQETSREKGLKEAAMDKIVVDANVEFCAVLRTNLGPHGIVMGAEMDCYETDGDGNKSYVELKTSRQLQPHTVNNFERYKLPKFWIQSFLAGVPVIACGFRDDRGFIVQTEMMMTNEIAKRLNQKQKWEGGVCLAFADQVFCWLYETVNESENYVLRFVPPANRLELVRSKSCPDTISKHVDELSGVLGPGGL